MDFIEWCETVLTKMIDLGQDALEAQTYGIDEPTLAQALFPASELEGEQFNAIASAARQLRLMGLVRELGEGSQVWELTEAGRRHAKAPRLMWRDICLTDIDLPQVRELLATVNRLSQHSTEQYAYLESIEYETIGEELAWAKDWAQFRAAAFRLVDLEFATGDFASQSAELRATLRGLIWERRCVKSKIFVSYQRAPSESFALLISEKLSQYGVTVFVDTLTVEGAETFPDRLAKGIDECDVFVCLLAPTTLNSEWVRREIERAAALGKPMIPVFQPGYAIPDGKGLPDYVQKLLSYEGVLINSGYVAAAIDKLASMIEQTWFKSLKG